PVEAVTERGLVGGTVKLAGKMVEQFDTKQSVKSLLEEAHIALRPGEFMIISLATGLALGAVLVGITSVWLFGVVGLVLGPVGGKLADLLRTLADFIRAREEVRREVMVLTAEGRISAWVLGALPLFLLLVIQVIDPGYMKPMYHGWGIPVLIGTAASVAAGT